MKQLCSAQSVETGINPRPHPLLLLAARVLKGSDITSFLGACLFLSHGITYRSSHHTKLVTLFPQVPTSAVWSKMAIPTQRSIIIAPYLTPLCKTNENSNSDGLQSLQKDLPLQFQLSFSTSVIFLIIMMWFDELTFFHFL